MHAKRTLRTSVPEPAVLVSFERLGWSSVVSESHDMRSRRRHLANEIYAMIAVCQFDLDRRVLTSEDDESPFELLGPGASW